jgi:hypothetical protein
VNATELISLMNRTTFQPLQIHLYDGSVVTVHDPFEIATQRTSPCFIVDSGQRMEVIAYRNVTKISIPVSAE